MDLKRSAGFADLLQQSRCSGGSPQGEALHLNEQLEHARHA